MPIKVVFLTFYYEAWDALDEAYRLMLADDRFEPIVISIPRKLTGDEGYGHEADVSAFFDAQGIEHLRFDYADGPDGRGSFAGLERLREIAPAYVFLNYPWRRNYQAAYRAENLVSFTKVAYVPYYSLPLVNEPGETGVAGHMYEQRTHQLASLVFTQDAASLEAYAHTDRGNGYVHLTGSPKLDVLQREAREAIAQWPIAVPSTSAPSAPRNFRLVWAPHHSYGANWLNFGVFAQMYLQMLAFAKSHPNVDVVLRPHPFLFGTLVDREVISAEALAEWQQEWNALPNTAIHTEGSYATLFMATDLMVTDGISFLGEYPILTGKPTIFIENPNHWDFAPLGELAAAANIRVHSYEEFESVFDQIRTDGLPDFSEQIAALRAAANPYPGKAAKRIVELTAADYAAGTPLVDPSVIKTPAWEFREGREPQPE
jgi:CDP-glycerol glycerophosphotransferase (TagB/SpsB family)